MQKMQAAKEKAQANDPRPSTPPPHPDTPEVRGSSRRSSVNLTQNAENNSPLSPPHMHSTVNLCPARRAKRTLIPLCDYPHFTNTLIYIRDLKHRLHI